VGRHGGGAEIHVGGSSHRPALRRRHLIDVLRGKATEKVGQFGHDQLPTFGVGADLDEAAWRSVARQLLAGGLLYADAQHYGALKLTDAARPVLKAETTLMLRRQVVATKKAGRPKYTAPADLSPAGTSLFDTLRQWRGQTAREQGVPAYVILHDRTLHELAARQPRSLDELLGISGIGEAKVGRYGAALLELISVTE
jgi:ATP-dependent DNA helicase RecQ